MLINQDRKNLILMFLSDNSGCSHVRCRFFADYINANNLGVNVAILPPPVYDSSVLSRVKAIIWQKCVGSRDLEIIRRYKSLQNKFGYKLVYEVDDLFFYPTVDSDFSSFPEYNSAFVKRAKNENSMPEIENTLNLIIPLFDTIMVSTDYLGKIIREKYKHEDVVTVKNTVPRFLWSCDKKKPITQDLEVPEILYSGASGHYLNPTKEEKGNKGDWDNNLGEWVIKAVADNKIRLSVMGSFPYFLSDYSYKIKFIPWANSYNYPRRCWSTKADFQIAPLVENEFNYCKSALRFYESSIAGMGFIGSTFGNPNKKGPYDEIWQACQIDKSLTQEEITERFELLKKKDPYNDMISWQYDHLDKSGIILESSTAVNKILSICDSQCSLESI